MAERRCLQRLTDEQMVLLVTWLDQEDRVTSVELARRLNRPYFTVAKAVQRIRRRGGWHTALEWGMCSECGLEVPMPVGTVRTVHIHCERARTSRYSRERRKMVPGQSTPYVRAYRAAHPELLPAKREAERPRIADRGPNLSEAEREEMLSRVHASDRRDYPLTLELAESRGDPWAPDEDAYMLEHWHEPAREVALALGRTLWGIRSRKVRIRRQKAQQGVALPRSNRKE